jgi:ribonuclease HI
MMTLPPTYPLAKGLKTAYSFCAKRDFEAQKRRPSPLHKLQNTVRTNPETMEKITPVRHFPKWTPDVEVSIATKEKDAIREDKQANECLRVYSDGSAVDGGVGGAAVLMRGKRMIRGKRFYLGSETEHTVYEAEMIGMILAVEILREEGREGTMSLGVDNQDAIRAIGAFHSKPDHYLVGKFYDDLRRFLPDNDGRKLVIRWTPGHKGIAGNEHADKQAKRAARGETSESKQLPRSLQTKAKATLILPLSKSATKQQLKDRVKSKAKEKMRQSPHFHSLDAIDPSPSKHFASIVEYFHSSLLFQLRSGHTPLNKHLHLILKSPTARCLQCNGHDESVEHLPIVCPAYTVHTSTSCAP